MTSVIWKRLIVVLLQLIASFTVFDERNYCDEIKLKPFVNENRPFLNRVQSSQ